MAIIFSDTFTGSAGILSAHSPDVGAAGFSWSTTNASVTLDGSGGVVFASTDFAVYQGTEIPSIYATLEISFTTPTTLPTTPGVVLFDAYVIVGAQSCQLQVLLNSSGVWTLRVVATDQTITTIVANIPYVVTLACDVSGGSVYGEFSDASTFDTSLVFDPLIGFQGFALRASSGVANSLSLDNTGGAPINGNALLYAPVGTMLSSGGAEASVVGPKQQLSATAHNSAGEFAANLTAPFPTLLANSGGAAALSAPAPLLSITGTAVAPGNAALSAPVATVSATGSSGVVGAASTSLAPPSPNLVGYSGAVCSVSVTGRVTVLASGTTGGVGSSLLTAPLFTLQASGAATAHGSASLIAPSPKLGASVQVYLIAPSAELVAIGSATVSVTYEAYAVNLAHAPNRSGEAPTDEVTHYTNFPFDRIVRYKNSYFGMNATGLYLLEGTTDDTGPTQFALETHKTDFKTTEMKTVISAYFGGKLGPAETVSIIAGEKAPVTYSYTTPRGSLAQNYRQKFGRGLKSRYYAFAVSGEDVFELDTLDIEINKLTRSI